MGSHLKQTTRVAGAPRGPRKHEERCDALLDAAAALFVEKGLGATSIDDIVERAGVAKGTFYHYFPDRAAMLAALRGRYSQHFADLSAEAMIACDAKDIHARLDAWIATVLREYVSSYALHDAIFHETSACHRCVMSEEPVVQILAELLDYGEKLGEWVAEDSLAVAVCMFHSLHGLVDEAIATGSDTDDIAPFLTRMFSNMLHRAPYPPGLKAPAVSK